MFMLVGLFWAGSAIWDHFTTPKNAPEPATSAHKDGHSHSGKPAPTKTLAKTQGLNNEQNENASTEIPRAIPIAKPKPPLAQTPPPKPASPAPVPQIPAQPASEPAPPRPAIISMPDGSTPVAGEIPRARPISPVAKIAAADSDMLADLSPPKPRVISRGAVAADSNTTVLEAKRKSWVTVRTGPGGQTLFEDYLYPTTKPLQLPKGRYFIEMRDADAVEITRNGQRIRYSQPGVVVE